MARTTKTERNPKQRPRQVKRQRQQEAMEPTERASLPLPDPPKYKPEG